MAPHTKRDLKNSIYDGMFANMFATLTGGMFLTGFALYLGMNEFMIGLLASMPFIVTVFQLPAASAVIRTGKRKMIAYWAAALARVIWIPIVLVTLLPFLGLSIKAVIVLGLAFLSYACVSVSYVSWLSWMSDLVPEDIRGSFFGTRNMICGAAGMIVLIVFGGLLDGMNGYVWGSLPVGFVITFISAAFFGIISLYFLNRISEPTDGSKQESLNSFLEGFAIPFAEPNFKRFLLFTFSWSFSVYFASPFFTLYFLRELKFSYGFVAFLSMISAFADLIGMKIWGRVSDKVKNKPVIQFAGRVAIFLPLAWVLARPQGFVLPVALHIIGGGFWAGINLCTNNLLLNISHKKARPLFFSAYNITGGMGAATAPILAGLLLHALSGLQLPLFSWNLLPVHGIFMISTLLRLLSFQILKDVHEPEEIPVGQMVRVLRSIRGLNMANGFSYLLHPFIHSAREKREF